MWRGSVVLPLTHAHQLAHPRRGHIRRADIVEAILAGRQPADLTLKDLMLPFPVEWAGQRVQFGVGGGE
ncbi:hypothetical protein E4Q08_13800 [Candidatus Accumulibacter phosphatis]|uniref:Uncharacterized protein n=1 Tax=Candidatus Accumulibacter contiguus TaxID=2954381 RepID=A0ABX1T987_9PROT|nr:hypothetical protein [Candidatus Accumulibacter contiguus]